MSGSLFPFELTVDKLEHVNTNKPNGGGKKKKSKLQENKGIVTKEQVKNSFFYIVKK